MYADFLSSCVISVLYYWELMLGLVCPAHLLVHSIILSNTFYAQINWWWWWWYNCPLFIVWVLCRCSVYYQFTFLGWLVKSTVLASNVSWKYVGTQHECRLSSAKVLQMSVTHPVCYVTSVQYNTWQLDCMSAVIKTYLSVRNYIAVKFYWCQILGLLLMRRVAGVEVWNHIVWPALNKTLYQGILLDDEVILYHVPSYWNPWLDSTAVVVWRCPWQSTLQHCSSQLCSRSVWWLSIGGL